MTGTVSVVSNIPRHRVFISFHEKDIDYKRRLLQMMGDLIVDVSVDEDDIDDTNLVNETIRQEIRNRYIRQASVTIVLIGCCSWQRMHVDSEIHSSIRETDFNKRCGLLGIFLPEHPDHDSENYNDRLIPARLADNVVGEDSYAELHDWPRKRAGRRYKVQQWIHDAFNRKRSILPISRRPLLTGNIGGRCSDG